MHQHAKPAHRVLVVAIVLTLGFAVVECIGGFWANSLALLSDAGHMASDSLALSISAFAAWLALKPASDNHTFGFSRAEVIAAWISSLLMIVLSVVIVVEAIERLHQPSSIKGPAVMLIAFIGLLVNIYIAWLLSRSEQTLNIRAAMLHVLSDVLGSLAALVSGAVVTYTHWLKIDPILSIVIAALILFASLRLWYESLTVLMERVPRHIDTARVRQDILNLSTVVSLHDLHIWTLSSGKIILSCHITISTMPSWATTLQQLHQLLRDKYHIEHMTLQPELTAQPNKANCSTPLSGQTNDKNHSN